MTRLVAIMVRDENEATAAVDECPCSICVVRRDRAWLLARVVGLANALQGVALFGRADLPLWSWCDDDWTCAHAECAQGRAALAALDEPA